MRILPLLELLPNQDRLNSQTVGQTQEHSAVAVSAVHVSFIHFQTLEPVLQFFFQHGCHEDGSVGRGSFSLFQNQNRVAALTLILELPENHGLRRASRWFCKFYCRNAVIVGLIARRSSVFPFNQCISAF